MVDERILARVMHVKYEEIAKKYNWNTQESCKTDFDKLPERNQKVMVGVAREVIKFIDKEQIKGN